MLHFPTVKGICNSHRHPFIVKGLNQEKNFEARVDGYLESENGDIIAILEVKPHARYNTDKVADNIKMQKGA